MSMFQVFKDKRSEWRWRLRANNNQVIATSGEGYHNRKDCIHGIYLVKDLAPETEVIEQEKNKF